MQWIGEGAQFALRHREAVGGRTLCLVLAPRSAKRSVARALPWGSSISAFGTRAAASTSDTTPTARGDSHQPHLQLHHPAQLACQTHAGNNPVCNVSAASENTCAQLGTTMPRANRLLPALRTSSLRSSAVYFGVYFPPNSFLLRFLPGFLPSGPVFGVARKFFDGGICARRAECGGRGWSTGACEGMVTENAFLVLRGCA